MNAPVKLERRNADQWAILRTEVDRLLRGFEKQQEELISRAKAARPDGFPAGGDGGHGSGVADPTLGAVIARQGVIAKDPAVRAISELNNGLALLVAAGRDLIEAFPPKPKKIAEPDGWCRVCLTIGWHSPVDTNKRHAQPNARCSWCSDFVKEQGFEPPTWILKKRARGNRIYDVDIAKAVTEHEAEKVSA